MRVSMTRAPSRSSRPASDQRRDLGLGARRGHGTASGAQRERERLVATRRRVEHLEVRFGRLAARDPVDVALRRAHVPPPATVGVPVRRAADRQVLALRPVALVVAAGAPAAGPVRDLVPLEAGGTEHGVGEHVLLGLVVVVGRRARARGDVPAERRAGLDGERVRS